MPDRRYVYLALFALPTLLLAAIAGTLAVGAAAGALWLFVYGDETWPEHANVALGIVLVHSSGFVWATLLAVAYRVGRQQEGRPAINRAHVALAIGTTALLGAIVAARLLGLSIGSPADTARCAEYCQERGFAASGMPPRDSGDRTCTCYDTDGTARMRTTLE